MTTSRRCWSFSLRTLFVLVAGVAAAISLGERIGIRQLLGWSLFCLPFVFSYTLLCQMQEDRSDRSEVSNTGGESAVDGTGGVL